MDTRKAWGILGVNYDELLLKYNADNKYDRLLNDLKLAKLLHKALLSVYHPDKWDNKYKNEMSKKFNEIDEAYKQIDSDINAVLKKMASRYSYIKID